MPNLRPVLGLAALLAIPACVKTQPPEADAGGAASLLAASAAPVPASAAAPPAASPADSSLAPAAMTLFGRLDQEAKSRPPIHPNADDVFAAFAKAGGEIPTKSQGLGATYKAKFCEGGTTGNGLVTVGVCEYPDAESAKAGLQTIKDIYPAKGATHVLRKSTVLSTLKLKDGPPAQALESKLLAAYQGL